MTNDIAIKVENLSKCYQIYDRPDDRLKQFLFRSRRQYYREFWALKDVSFEIKKGETVGIIGRNGSGKSTLLQMICGTLNPTTGSVKTKGRVAALLELGSGFNPEFTGFENIWLYASVLGLSNEEIASKIEKIVGFADIGDFIDQPVKTYSSGMVVRLAFSVVAHVEADVLIVDEALAVGDIFFTAKCINFLKEFAQRGTILFVSHDIGAVTSLCDSAVLIHEGKLVLQGTPKEVIKSYHANYLGPKTKEAPHNKNSILVEKQFDLPGVNKLSGFRLDNGIAGIGFGKILAACFTHNGEVIRSLLSGTKIQFKIWAQLDATKINPILGFSLKNKHGQLIFECNTSQEHLFFQGGQADKYVFATFEFDVPNLSSGEYLVDVALANGTQLNHEQLQWVYSCMAVTISNPERFNGMLKVNCDRIMVGEV